ncbi:MAG: hypothetical protein QM501_02920 [Gimesia sp.]
MSTKYSTADDSLWDQIKSKIPLAIVAIGALCLLRLVWMAFDASNSTNGKVMTPNELRSIVEQQMAIDKAATDRIRQETKSKKH